MRQIVIKKSVSPMTKCFYCQQTKGENINIIRFVAAKLGKRKVMIDLCNNCLKEFKEKVVDYIDNLCDHSDPETYKYYKQKTLFGDDYIHVKCEVCDVEIDPNVVANVLASITKKPIEIFNDRPEREEAKPPRKPDTKEPIEDDTGSGMAIKFNTNKELKCPNEIEVEALDIDYSPYIERVRPFDCTCEYCLNLNNE